MRFLGGALLIVLAGCPTSDDGDDGSPTDSGLGPDNCEIGKGVIDGGVNILGPCNPGNGMGCISQNGQACQWNVSTDEGSCVCPGADPNPVGQACTRFDCAAGTACLDIAGAGPVCHQVCNTQDAEECDALSAGADIYGCVRIQRTDPMTGMVLGPTVDFGICRVIGTRCDPLMDDCPMGETCSIITRVTTACFAGGSVPVGGDCTDDNCAKGGVCVPLADAMGNPVGNNCYETCAAGAPDCTAGTCTDVGLTFGICI